MVAGLLWEGTFGLGLTLSGVVQFLAPLEAVVEDLREPEPDEAKAKALVDRLYVTAKTE